MGKAQLQNFSVHSCGFQDLSRLRALVGTLGHEKEADYFERQLEYAAKFVREVLIVQEGDIDAGYAILNWEPKYGLFRKFGIPEIQDLNILPGFRRRGLATFLIGWCEARARKKGRDHMGIGVGLYAAYGPAQILYARLGYVPDGNGASYDRQPMVPGEIRPVDDQLCLMMLKDLL